MSAKLVVLYNPPTDPSAFDAHYEAQHVPLVKAVPGLGSITVSVGPVGTPGGPAPYHRVATMTFASMADLQAGLGSPEGGAAAEDLASFATGGATMLVFDEVEL